MSLLTRVLRAIRNRWHEGPKSLFALAREPRRKSPQPTSKLYVIEADFEITPEAYDALQTHLDLLREKYGLDFMILEPGFKLKRFDDY